MDAAVALSSIIFGVFASLGVFVTARKTISDGRREREARDRDLRAEGFREGVASIQAELLDLRAQLAQITDDRNYWRSIRRGADDRSRGDR